MQDILVSHVHSMAKQIIQLFSRTTMFVIALRCPPSLAYRKCLIMWSNTWSRRRALISWGNVFLYGWGLLDVVQVGASPETMAMATILACWWGTSGLMVKQLLKRKGFGTLLCLPQVRKREHVYIEVYYIMEIVCMYVYLYWFKCVNKWSLRFITSWFF